MRSFGRGAVGFSGFTLIEVGLAITVGAVLVAAGIFLYQQARENAGDSIARQRVADVQVLVENHFTTHNRFPNEIELPEIWGAARLDATQSPWGGAILQPNGLKAWHLDTKIDGNCLDVGNAGDEVSEYVDSLTYHLVLRPNDSCSYRLWDAGAKQHVALRAYGVGTNKHGKAFYFVRSGR